MIRKFFLYGYAHFFDGKFRKSIAEFEFLKSQITSKDEVAEKLSYLLMFAYGSENNIEKAREEANYFLNTFPDGEYKKYVNEYLEALNSKAET